MGYIWMKGNNLTTYNSIKFIQEEIRCFEEDLNNLENSEDETKVRLVLQRLEKIEEDLEELMEYRQLFTNKINDISHGNKD